MVQFDTKTMTGSGTYENGFFGVQSKLRTVPDKQQTRDLFKLKCVNKFRIGINRLEITTVEFYIYK